MAQNPIQRPSLGQWMDLGALYDARTDTFVDRSLLMGDLPETTYSITDHAKSKVQLLSSDTFEDKFSSLGVGTELGASFLAGMVNVAGAAEYLNDEPNKDFIEQASIYYETSTVEERLGIGNSELTNYITLTPIQGSGATHVLTAIDWGAQTIVTTKGQISQSSDRTDFQNLIQREFGRVEHKIQAHDQKGFLNGDDVPHTTSVSLDITVYSDILDEPGHAESLRATIDWLMQLSAQMAQVNDGKGMPLRYTLMPLNMLKYMLTTQVDADATFVSPNLNYLEGFTKLFDELQLSRRKLEDTSEVCNYRNCVPHDFIEKVENSMRDAKTVQENLRSDFRGLLQAVRSNTADSKDLAQILANARKNVPSPESTCDLAKQYQEKIAFVQTVVADGIDYLGYGAERIEALLRRHNVADAYILFFTESLRLKSESWDENFRFLQRIRTTNASGRVVAIVDCDATGVVIESPRVSRFQDAKLVVQDVLSQVKYGNCYVTCINQDELVKDDAKRPSRRSAVKIPCPGPNCQQTAVQDWACHTCGELIEYGAADQHIYCNCGRSTYANYGFKCKELEHGPLFESYERGHLLQLLSSLDPMDELNILIIGETGVGKSTFINAFINYLTYSTLDEALQNDNLDWLIPCSFNYQTMDRSDPNARILQRKIQVGEDQDEKDGAGGESATQKSMVYPVTHEDTVVRLIDTPGIGDTRGVEKDQENMMNILSMLSNFENLHGILFLLKSNSARLTLMFRFVMEELLTHLHRDATLNMVFGFTNTRISNYMPGDTYAPLQNLLKKHTRVNIDLSPRTVYCFDSESFRFLAAHKKGVTMENIQDFRLSWDKSERETKRLVEHFRSLEPHAVRSTLSLNQTRALILHLTKPMTDIMQTIEKTIQMNKDNMEELRDQRLRGDELRTKLHWERIELVHHSLDRPRTVCNDLACKDYRDDGYGTKQTIYKSHCHAECNLDNVEVGALSCSALTRCWAFPDEENCQVCGHHWENHLHVRHELEESLKTVQDEAVVEQLKKNAGDITLKETAIKQVQIRIAESRYEYQEIQEAAVRFCVYLQKNSINKGYNDATEEYLVHLIKEEKDKISVGGRQERLETLERQLKEHIERRRVLEESISSGRSDELLDESGVQNLVEHLYRLKHWGKNLRDIKNQAEADHLAEYREKSYRPGKNARASASAGSKTNEAIKWLAGHMLPSTTTNQQHRAPSIRVAPPYQSRSSGTARPSIPEYMPGGYPSNGSSGFAIMNRQVHRPQPPPQRQPQMKSQAQHPPPVAQFSEMTLGSEDLRQRKGKSFTDKLLRPFTKR